MSKLHLPIRIILVTLILLPGWLFSVTPALASNCAQTSTSFVALPDLGTGVYKGQQGGLYPGGTNEPPQAYAKAGIEAAAAVVPRNAQGKPQADGKIVLLSIGMSNATQEFAAFVALASNDPSKDARVVMVDGAQGGQTARAWATPDSRTWSQAEQRLNAAGVTSAQVEVIWLKNANAGPTGDDMAYAANLANGLKADIRIAAQKFPNLQQVFVSPRTYAGYASTPLNPEPYAYASGFAVKDVVSTSVGDPAAPPWIGWGPYLWTNGTNGRKDGFTWTCADSATDGTHPSSSGRMKIAVLLQQFFDASPFTGWYRTASVALPSARPAVDPIAKASTPNWPLAIAIAMGTVILAGMSIPLLRRRRTSRTRP